MPLAPRNHSHRCFLLFNSTELSSHPQMVPCYFCCFFLKIIISIYLLQGQWLLFDISGPSNVLVIESGEEFNSSLGKVKGILVMYSFLVFCFFGTLKKYLFCLQFFFFQIQWIDDSLPAIFYFTAAWCGPCKFVVCFLFFFLLD